MRLTALLPLLLVLSCGPSGPVVTDEAEQEGGKRRAEVEAFVTQFGNAVIANDWNAAYSMLLPEYQSVMSQDAMSQKYQELVSMIVKDDPSFKPNTVYLGFGVLPNNEQEAKEYGIVLPPPKDTWIDWLYCGIGWSKTGEAGDVESGVEASVLVVDMYGKLQIAHLEWQFMD